MIIDMRVRLPQEYRTTSKEKLMDFYGKYIEVLQVQEALSRTTDDLLKDLKKHNISTSVVHAEYEFGENPDELNKNVAHLVKKYPEKLAGFGTVDLTNLHPANLMRQAEDIANYHLKGINLQPVFFHVDPLDRRLYPLYAIAEKLGLIVSFHTGIHYSMKSSFIDNNPLFIDQIAVDFPTLKIIACHGAWPWTAEMTAVARRHSNVFIEFGGMDPKYIGIPGTGWETLFTMMNNLLSNQIIFGTDWPVMSIEKSVKSWQQLGLKAEVLEKLFYKNAAKLLQL